MEKQNFSEINGVILSPDAIQCLKDFQEGDNSLLVGYLNLIADVTQYLGMELHSDNDEQDIELKKLIANLCYLRRNLAYFKKPENL